MTHAHKRLKVGSGTFLWELDGGGGVLQVALLHQISGISHNNEISVTSGWDTWYPGYLTDNSRKKKIPQLEIHR